MRTRFHPHCNRETATGCAKVTIKSKTLCSGEPMKKLIVIEGDLKALKNRLQKGRIVKGRIVLIISDKHYLLRLLGRNLIMSSPLRFKRFQEVYFKVIAIHPRIQLQVFNPQRELIFQHQPKITDIIA